MSSNVRYIQELLDQQMTELQDALSYAATYEQRALAFLQPSHGEAIQYPRLPNPSVCMLNAIVFVRALESNWPGSQSISTAPLLQLASRFQRDTVDLLVRIDCVHFVRMINNVHSLDDDQLEMLRIFYILIDELETAVGFRGAHPYVVVTNYYTLGIDRAMRAGDAALRLIDEVEASLSLGLRMIEAEREAAGHRG